MSGLVGSLVSTAGNLIGGGLSQVLARSNQNAANEWNSPVNMIRQYRQAGINPYSAVSGGQTVGHSQPVNSPDFGSLGSQAAQSFQQTYALEEQKQQLLSQVQSNIAESKVANAKALETAASTKGKGIWNDIYEFASNDVKQQFALENQVRIQQAASLKATTVLTNLQANGQKLQNDNYKRIIDMSLAKQVAEINELYTRGVYNSASARQAYQNALLAASSRAKVDVEKDVLEKQADSLVKQAEKQADLLESQTHLNYSNVGKVNSEKLHTDKRNENFWWNLIPMVNP